MEKILTYHLESSESLAIIDHLREKGYSGFNWSANYWETFDGPKGKTAGQNTKYDESSGSVYKIRVWDPDLEIILDKFLGRDSNPLDLPQTSP